MTDLELVLQEEPSGAGARLFATPVLAVQDWPTNGHLIADVAELYFAPDARVLDVTYGSGKWWTIYRPTNLVTHNRAVDGVDFRNLPHADATFDVVAFDPPYVPGGTTADDDDPITGYHRRYGLHDDDDCPRNVEELTALIVGGLSECARVVVKGGYVLVKCQPFQAGRIFHHMPRTVMNAAETMGLRLVDEFIHRRRPGPTSADEFNRARRNHSNLLIFDRRHRRPPRRRTPP